MATKIAGRDPVRINDNFRDRLQQFVMPLVGCLHGTAVVAYALAFGRWGSHVHLPGVRIYLTDLLVAAALVSLVATSDRRSYLRRLQWSSAPVVAIAILAGLRFVAGLTLSVDAVRDVTPYLYAAIVLLPLQRAAPRAAARTLAVLRAALLIRLVLVTLVLAFPAIVESMPVVATSGPDSQVLALRADFDSACLAVLALSAAVSAVRASGRRRLLECALALGSGLVALRLGSRSGLLALIVGALIVLAVAGWPSVRRVRPAKRAAITILAIALIGLAAPHVDAVRRLGKIPQAVGVGVDPSQKEADATGTAKARLYAWRRTLAYTNADVGRWSVGVGFGPDFLHDANAADVFEGHIYSGVRAPHNYFINTYARLGLVGLTVVVAAFLYVLACAAVVLRSHPDELELFAVVLLTALLVTASLGVILESPFGALPAFWSAGVILAGREARAVSRHRSEEIIP